MWRGAGAGLEGSTSIVGMMASAPEPCLHLAQLAGFQHIATRLAAPPHSSPTASTSTTMPWCAPGCASRR